MKPMLRAESVGVIGVTSRRDVKLITIYYDALSSYSADCYVCVSLMCVLVCVVLLHECACVGVA